MLVLGELLRRNAAVVPDKAAYVYRDGGERVVVTYRELNSAANRFANALGASGARRGDRIGFFSRNNGELAMAMWGAVKAGLVAMPLNFRYTGSEAAALLAQGQPRWVVAAADLVDLLLDEPCKSALDGGRLVTFGPARARSDQPCFAEVLASAPDDEPAVEIAETDPYILLCTSGTTGPAKGVLHSHRAYYLQTGNPVLSGRGTGERDVGLCPYQLFHSSGWRTSLIYWRARATVVILNRPTVEAVLSAVEQERVTQVMALPQTLLEMCRAGLGGRDVSSVEAVNTGTSAIAPEDAARIRRLFPKAEYRVHYGASEAGPVSSLAGADVERRPTSVGQPTLHVDVRIVGADSQEVAPGDQGEIAVRSDFLMLGYRGADELTRQAVVDGWYHTGDLGRLDDEGFLYVTGRVKDVIRSAGESIYPAEVETCLTSHAAVRECAVVGLPDERWGEVVGAMVVPEEPVPDETAAAVLSARLLDHARSRLAGYKVPKKLVFADELPRVEATAKVAKADIRRILGTAAGQESG